MEEMTKAGHSGCTGRTGVSMQFGWGVPEFREESGGKQCKSLKGCDTPLCSPIFFLPDSRQHLGVKGP